MEGHLRGHGTLELVGLPRAPAALDEKRAGGRITMSPHGSWNFGGPMSSGCVDVFIVYHGSDGVSYLGDEGRCVERAGLAVV
jgi:hypothetical protein